MKKIRQGHTSTSLMKQCLNTIEYLSPEPQLSDFYLPSENQKNDELLFVAAGTGIATYALYK